MELGLFSEVVPAEQLMPRCLEIARTIASMGPIAISYCKAAVNLGTESTLSHGLSHEAELFAQTFATDDQKEGMLAFIEKRAAHFQGK